MKLVSPRLEMSLLMTVCSAPKRVGSTAIGSVNQEYFYHKPALDGYNRLVSLLRERGEIPSWEELIHDPVLPGASKEALQESSVDPVKSASALRSILSGLNKYRTLRELYFNAEDTISALQKGEVNLDELVDENSDAILRARQGSVEQSVLHVGRGNNSKNAVNDLLDGESPILVPTGFTTFDDRNGGIPLGALFIVGASTSGGKSAVAGQLLINMASQGFDSVIVPLEMTESEVLTRLLSNLSRIQVEKFAKRELTPGEKTKVRKKYRAFVNKLKKMKSRYTIVEPQEDVTVEEILFSLRPYGHEVIIIDYISLLKGVGGTDMWIQLGNVARFCKVYAKNNNVVIILLAQLNADGSMRYAKSILEHANNSWTWVVTDESKGSGVIDIRQNKARNQIPFPFQLGVNFKYMRIFDVKPDATDRSDSSAGEEDEVQEYLDDLADDLED